MRTLIIILALLLLTGCIPESDNVKITRDLITMKETATANTAAIKALTARVDALTTENANLKAQSAAVNTAMAKLATRDEVAKWINDSLTPKEWADVKATANNAAAQVAMLNSRQASLENKVQLSLINQQQLTPAFVAANYATKGDIYTLQTQYTDLAYWVTQLRAKIGI